MEWRINPTGYLNRTPDGRLSGGHVSSAALIWGPHRMPGHVYELLLEEGLFTTFTDITPPSSGTLITCFFFLWVSRYLKLLSKKILQSEAYRKKISADDHLEGCLPKAVGSAIGVRRDLWFNSESKCNFPLIISYLSIPWGSWLLAWASRGWTFFNHNVTDGPVGRDHFLRATLMLRGMLGHFLHTEHLSKVRAFVYSIRVAFS